jgi:hypothetical protein
MIGESSGNDRAYSQNDGAGHPPIKAAEFEFSI